MLFAFFFLFSVWSFLYENNHDNGDLDNYYRKFLRDRKIEAVVRFCFWRHRRKHFKRVRYQPDEEATMTRNQMWERVAGIGDFNQLSGWLRAELEELPPFAIPGEYLTARLAGLTADAALSVATAVANRLTAVFVPRSGKK